MCYHVRAFAFLSFPEALIAHSKCLVDTINHTPPCRIRLTRSVLQTCSSLPLPDCPSSSRLFSTHHNSTQPLLLHSDAASSNEFSSPCSQLYSFPHSFSVFGPPSPHALYHRSFTLHAACPRVLGSWKHGPGLNHLCAHRQCFAPSDAEGMFPERIAM